MLFISRALWRYYTKPQKVFDFRSLCVTLPGHLSAVVWLTPTRRDGSYSFYSEDHLTSSKVSQAVCLPPAFNQNISEDLTSFMGHGIYF